MLLDQTALPRRVKFIRCAKVKDVWQAIKRLKVRGAPLIGIAAGFGAVVSAHNFRGTNVARMRRQVLADIDYLAQSRPTAVNLFWALARMKKIVKDYSIGTVRELKSRLLTEAQVIFDEDRDLCNRMAGFGESLIRSNDVIMTHCNAGRLATGGCGTALGVIYRALEQGKRIKVYNTETRPLLQGARLTAWELQQAGVDVTLVCDNMAGAVMQQKNVSKIFVGADRIAGNGDTANKIGTYSLAVLARHHHIPFYVVAPTSTFDFSICSGSKIPIEQRNPAEIKSIARVMVAPPGISVYNPAFDVTPAKLITGIITEYGICYPPYSRSLKKLSRICRRNHEG